MTQRASEQLRNKLQQLLFGTVLGGMLLFQGTGFITNHVFAADDPSQNIEVNTTGTTAVTGTTYYTGLTGTSGSTTANTSGTITVATGAMGVVGVLDTTKSTLSLTDTVNLTVDNGGSIVLATDTTTSSNTNARLIIAGTSDSAGSSLTINNGGLTTVHLDGLLQIGTTADVDDLASIGTVHVLNGGQLYNAGGVGVSSTLDRGVVINKGSSLTLGTSADNLWTGDGTSTNAIYAGNGRVQNFGTMTFYNADGDNSEIYIGVYADKNTTDSSTGTLTTYGNLEIEGGESGTIVINGTVATGKTVDGVWQASNLSLLNDLNVVTGGFVKTGDLSLGTNVDAITNAGSLAIDGTIISSATTMAISNTGTAAFGELNLASGWTYTNNTTKDSTSVGSTFDTLKITGGTFTNTEGTIGIDHMNFSDGSFTATSGKIAIGVAATVNDDANGLTMSGGTFTNKAATVTIVSCDMSGGSFETTGGTTTFTKLTLADGTVSTSSGSTTLTNLTQSAGTLAASGGTVTISNGNLSGGTINNNGGTMTITQLTQSAGTISQGSGALTLTNLELSGNGSLAAAGGSLTIGDMTVNIDNNADGTTANFLNISNTSTVTLKAGGALDVTQGTVDINSTNSTTKAFTVAGSSATTDGALLNLAFTEKNSGSLNTFANLTKGTLTLEEGSLIGVNNIDQLAAGTYVSQLANVADSNNGVVDNNSTFAYDGRVFYDFENATATNNYIMTLTVRDFSSFALTPNQKSLAKYMDAGRLAGAMSDDLAYVINDRIMQSAMTAAEVTAALDQLGGVQHANGLMLAMDSSWNYAFNQMDITRHKKVAPAIGNGSNRGYYGPGSYFRGQMACADGACADGTEPCGSEGETLGSLLFYGDHSPNSAWATFHYTSFNADNDGNSDEYGISRTGVTVGYDLLKDCDTVAGAMFGYSQPFLYADQHKINMSNFQFALYGARHFANDVELKLFGGYGMQEYTSKRNISFLNNERYNSVYDGSTLSLCARLSKDIQAGCWSFITPFVQFDMQQAWQDGAEETGTATGGAALAYDSSDWNRMFVRAGLASTVNAEYLQLTGRVLYAAQIGGDHAPSMSARFVGMGTEIGNFSLSGVDLGGNFAEAGIGALGYLDCSRNWSISGNYDFSASNHSNAHSASVSLGYIF